MRMRTLSAAAVLLPTAAASGQIASVPEFSGELFEGFEDKWPAAWTPCVEPRVFGGDADLCATMTHITGMWTHECVIRSFGGFQFYGSAKPGSASTYTFDEPVVRFGGWFGTNALRRGEPADGGRVEFYDESGGLIGDPQVLALDDQCHWHWHGWESDVPVFRVVIRGESSYGEGWVMMDDMRIDLFPSGECYADCDESGALDFFDFLCFQNAFGAGESYADCDRSSALDFFDFLCFQNAFAAGCP